MHKAVREVKENIITCVSECSDEKDTDRKEVVPSVGIRREGKKSVTIGILISAFPQKADICRKLVLIFMMLILCYNMRKSTKV